MIWINGTLMKSDAARIDPRDRGFTLGDGLFETIAALDGHPLHLASHLERMGRASHVLDLMLPVEATEVATAIVALLAANDLTQGRAALRLTLSRGVGSRGLLLPLDPKPTLVITASAHPPVPQSLDAAIVPIRRNEGSPLSRIKSLNYLDNVLAQQQAQALGAQEAVMLNNQGHVAGFARGNLFALLDGRWVTPPLADGVLDGITRHTLLQNGAETGREIAERSIEKSELGRAHGLFITNSLLGCVPVRRLDGQEIPSEPDRAAAFIDLLH